MLTFHNPGAIDIRGLLIAGLSAKADASTAIGKFGTGAKYAIAQVLAHGGQVIVWSGLQRYDFRTASIDFRGQASQVIEYRQGGQGASDLPEQQWHSMNITTHYGAHWEPWQIFRELYANARDEQGGVVASRQLPPAPDQTLVVVSGWPELIAEYFNRDSIILPADTPIISPIESTHLYYRGVRVMDRIGALTYNIPDGIDLTEDRTVQYAWAVHDVICRAIQSCDDPTLIRRQLTSKLQADKILRGSYHRYSPTTPEFFAVAVELFKRSRAEYGWLKEFAVREDPSLARPAGVKLSAIQQRMLDKAIHYVSHMGVDPHSVSISVCNLGPSCLGQYHSALDEVWLSPQLFDLGTKQLVSTLFEELIHRETGKEDCNYDMQTYLFNRIISLYEEHVIGEPL